MGAPSTQSESIYDGGSGQKPVPGALVVFSGNAPMLRAVPVPGPVVFGREEGIELPDEKMSRRHAQLLFQNLEWQVTDFDSRNGTFVDGRRIKGDELVAPNSVVRMGHSIILLVDDLRRFLGGTVTSDKFVIGPTLREVLDRIVVSARGGANVLVGGETGAGKELASETFHEAAAPKGRLVVVNCANVEKGIADRLFFGAMKGVGTDVKETVDGYVQAADGGTLFLDEIGELGADVQAKLLRVIENGEVARLGETIPRKVKVHFVAATHKDLRQATVTGDFRTDLYYRLAQIEARVPPLRERREEIPWLIAHAIAEETVRVANATFVEAALLRPWPGNVRDLLWQVKNAAQKAAAEGSKSIRDTHLASDAGIAPVRAARSGAPRSGPAVADAAVAPAKDVSAERLEAVLSETAWNVAEAARRLGLHRTQVNRHIKRYALKRPDGSSGDVDEDVDGSP